MTLHALGLVGLAVMGENLALNIAGNGFSVAVYNRTPAVTLQFCRERTGKLAISGFASLKDFAAALQRPRRILMMVKAGEPVDLFIDSILPYLEAGDILMDGGNSHYRDTERRLEYLAARGIEYIGMGISGGELGALYGPSIMAGGSRHAWPAVQEVLKASSAKVDGEPCCAWMGHGGAGHFVKMVHNGIEYGDMQLICEAYHLLKEVLGLQPQEMHEVFRRWGSGDLSSYLIDITTDIMNFPDSDGKPLLEKIADRAGQKGTGKWTVDAAIECNIPFSLVSEAVFARCLSSLGELRKTLSRLIDRTSLSRGTCKKELTDDIGRALYGAKIISYAQGFSLLRQASQQHVWQLDCGQIARIWRKGCIIRSSFLDTISQAYARDPLLQNILADSHFAGRISELQHSLRLVLQTGIAAGVPLPCHGAALNYLDGLCSTRLPANLLQAQRDYFGAHLYERIDRPPGEWFHTDWTGKGGKTTSGAYQS